MNATTLTAMVLRDQSANILADARRLNTLLGSWSPDTAMARAIATARLIQSEAADLERALVAVANEAQPEEAA